jgi:hypothetical protein
MLFSHFLLTLQNLAVLKCFCPVTFTHHLHIIYFNIIFQPFLVLFGAGLAQAVQCLTTGWMTGRSGFDPRQRRKDFSSNLCVQTGSGAHPASCKMGTGGPFPGGKTRSGRYAHHSPPSSAEVVNG